MAAQPAAAPRLGNPQASNRDPALRHGRQRGVRVKERQTDYGTIILHWLLVAAFVVAVLSGLRIATEAPDRTWINLFDAVLPRYHVWTAHMQAAIVLVAVALGYTDLYGSRRSRAPHPAGQDSSARIFQTRPAEASAVNALLYWIFFVTMLALLVSGGLLYFGFFSG